MYVVCIIEEEEVSQTGSETWDCGKIENEAGRKSARQEVRLGIVGKLKMRLKRGAWQQKHRKLQTDGRTSGQTDKVNPVYPPTTYSGRGV